MARWANRSFTVIWKDKNDAEIESSQGVCPVASSLVYLASRYLLGSIWVCTILATNTKWLLLWLNKDCFFSFSVEVKLQCSISFKYIGKWFRYIYIHMYRYISLQTMQGNCNHELKRCLLLGRKTWTNLDSILKSKDITLLTKIHIVKAMIFPVVMYRCESWAIKKAECLPKNWCFWTVVLEKTLESSLDSKESNQSILKEINPDYPLEGLKLKLKLKLQYFGYLMWRTDSLEKTLMLGKIECKRREGAAEDEMVR